MEITEWIGWIGNVIVIISFLQKNIKKLRVYGLIGALVWIVYAIRIESNSLIILNLVIMGIQMYHLYKLREEEKKLKYPWMYPIANENWKEQDPPIVSSLEYHQDFEEGLEENSKQLDEWHNTLERKVHKEQL